MMENFEFDEEVNIGPLGPEQFKMFIEANHEEANQMSLEQTSSVVAEGIYRLCMSVGEEIDSFIMSVDPEEMAEIAKTRPGGDMIRLLSIFGDSLVMIMESVNYLKNNFEDFDNHVKKFRSNVTKRLKDQEENLIQEFVDSIPDYPSDIE